MPWPGKLQRFKKEIENNPVVVVLNDFKVKYNPGGVLTSIARHEMPG